MPDFYELEKRFVAFRDKLEIYRTLYINILRFPDGAETPKRYEEERGLRDLLTCEYGELQADIHGMAGYNMITIAGMQLDIFLSALDPRLEKDNLIKRHGIEYAFQCINKAIGSCRYAKQVVRTEEQIIIKKGARSQGLMELRNLLSKAEKQVCIQDRYINADIFNLLDEIKDDVVIKIIIQKEFYKGKKALSAIYEEYRAKSSNIHIRHCEQKEFHSRKMLIDEEEGYLLDFTLQDIGKNESYLNRIAKPAGANNEFAILWAKSSALEEAL